MPLSYETQLPFSVETKRMFRKFLRFGNVRALWILAWYLNMEIFMVLSTRVTHLTDILNDILQMDVECGRLWSKFVRFAHLTFIRKLFRAKNEMKRLDLHTCSKDSFDSISVGSNFFCVEIMQCDCTLKFHTRYVIFWLGFYVPASIFRYGMDFSRSFEYS